MKCNLWGEKLDAYADESLPAEEREALDDHLRTCPSCTSEALARIQLKRATRAAGARFTPSPEFRLRMESALEKKQKPAWKIAWVPGLTTAAVALLLIAGSLSLFMRHQAREQAFTELLDQHVATLASANPVDVVSTDRHTVKPWFAGKLPFTFNLPELQDSPFKLLGGKLIYLNHSPGAQLLFKSGNHQLSAFIVQDQSGDRAYQTAAWSTRERGFSIESWTGAGLRYVIIGDTSPADVHALSDLLRAAARQ